MRIGFVLADLFTGSSVNLWPAVAGMFPDSGKDSLVIFPGGRLLSSSPLERMKNSIYDFVTPSNLDGLIIWCSALTGDASTDDVVERFRTMLSRPVVTIDGKTDSYPDIPDVRFDAYGGSLAIVRHCIEVHGFRRIAYIRGPENHMSAQLRFKAYRDALQEAGIEFNPDLVTDPAPWNRGAESVKQLLEVRKKNPGKDFDVLLCASDLMLYSAMQELNSRGFELGRDVFACGFNDSIESRLLSCPVTTVRMPASELGRSAVKSFYDLICGRPCRDKELPAVPVIRRSCGCNGGTIWSETRTLSEMALSIARHFRIPEDTALSVVGKAASYPSEKNVMDLVEMLCTDGADIFAITRVVNGFLNISNVSEVNRRVLVDSSREILPSVLDRKMSERSYRDRTRRNAFNTFNNELLEANSISEIPLILERNASALGFDRLVFRADDEFPVANEGLFNQGVWIAAPLCTETENMGFLLMKPVEFNGAVCEQIRSAVSSALKSSMLFESTRKAKIDAEAAEQAKTAFFANVGENLRDPLSEILQIVSDSGLDDRTKKTILNRITGANNIIDLALASTDELETDKYIVNIGNLLSGFGCYEEAQPLPNLLIDEKRMKQALETIIASLGDNASMKASMQRRGVRIDICGRVDAASGDPTALALARKIILMHNGTCSSSENGFSVVLPYPSLSGDVPRTWAEGETLACIEGLPPHKPADAVCEEISGLRFAESRKLPPSSGAVYWSEEFKGYNAVSAIITLISNPDYRNLPVICMNCPRSRTLEDALRSSLEEKGRTVLQIGSDTVEMGRWLNNPEIISCSPEDALSMFRKHEPALVLVSSESDNSGFIGLLRGIRNISQTPVILVYDSIDDAFVDGIGQIPNVIAVNSCIPESEEFAMRIRAVLGGAGLLSTNTSAIVKKAQAYICAHATQQISRWQIAEYVHVSEDYLTRMFKKELGLSPWDYLNRYRIWLACRLLKNSGMSVNDVSVATGFQDQAYFCRVFKKIRGFSPSRMRSSKKSELYKK